MVGRLGGRPLLPPDVDVPAGLALAAELDCAALAGYEMNLDLPGTGTLVFLAGVEGREGFVVYVPPGTAVTERCCP